MRVTPFLIPPSQHYDLTAIYRQLEQLDRPAQDAEEDYVAEGGMLVAGNAIRLSARIYEADSGRVCLALKQEYDRRSETWETIVFHFADLIRKRGVMPR